MMKQCVRNKERKFHRHLPHQYKSDAPCEKSVSTSIGDETKTYQNVVPSSIRDDESL